MKKIIIVALVLMAVVCVVPARGLSRELVYGFVLNPPGPFGPVKVQTVNFGVVKVNVPPNVTTASLFLGADVCCEVDADGALFIADLPNDSRQYTDKRSWLAQIVTWDPDNYNYLVTSPAGIVQILGQSGACEQHSGASRLKDKGYGYQICLGRPLQRNRIKSCKLVR